MREYVVNRPDAGAMRTLLERESDPEGVIVRLAWLAGFLVTNLVGGAIPG